MARTHGIISYGTPEDRARLAAIAQAERMSGSEWIIEKIRERYKELYGDTKPPIGD